MGVTSYFFLLFLALTAVAYRLCPPRLRSAIPLAASFAFYFALSGSYILLLIGAAIAAFLAAHSLHAVRNQILRRSIALLFVVAAVATLALFKSAPLIPALRDSILMPIGISYYTFKLIGYVLDVYWGKLAPEKHFFHFAAFVAFFPQIIAGPIQRAESLLPQLENARTPAFADYLWGVQRILLGYFKKFVVADGLGPAVDFVYAHSGAHATPLLLGFYLYPLQLYADFSGLTDIAVGSAALFGIVSPENFNAPFSASSPGDYWRRWHMTLTTWLTDYVFTPLRMAVRNWGNAGLVFSLFVNMVLIGIWHGFRLSFALFGVVHATYLSIDALTQRARKRFFKTHAEAARWSKWIAPVFTFHLIAVAFVLFRGESLAQTRYVLTHLAQGLGAPTAAFATFVAASGHRVLIGLGGYLIMELADYASRHRQRQDFVRELPSWVRWSVYSCTAVSGIFLVLILLASVAVPNPFLYAIF